MFSVEQLAINCLYDRVVEVVSTNEALLWSLVEDEWVIHDYHIFKDMLVEEVSTRIDVPSTRAEQMVDTAIRFYSTAVGLSRGLYGGVSKVLDDHFRPLAEGLGFNKTNERSYTPCWIDFSVIYMEVFRYYQERYLPSNTDVQRDESGILQNLVRDISDINVLELYARETKAVVQIMEDVRHETEV